MSDLERIVTVHPAYDCIMVQPCVHGSDHCKPGTGGSHGRHSAEMHLTVRGPDAEVTLVVNTGWDLPVTPKHSRFAHIVETPRGSFVEFHTARPVYEGQTGGEPRADGSCKDWSACYLNTGYTMADEPTRLLVEKGSDAVWEWLEAQYGEALSEMDELGGLS